MAGSLEDRLLTARIALVKANVMLALGRLREAATALAALRSLDMPGMEAQQQDLQLRLQLAGGAQADAFALARRLPPSDRAVTGSLVLAAVQALLASNDVAMAGEWIARVTGESDLSSDIARSLLAQAQGRRDDALETARRASAHAEDVGSPDDRVRTGLLMARLLLDQDNAEAASPVLGDLDAFAATDYRVAWEALALYRALNDPAMASKAMQRVQALRGEREVPVRPPL